MLLLYRGNGCDFIHVYLPYTIPDVSNNWTLLHYHQLWFHYRSLAFTKISVPWSLNKNHVSPPFCFFCVSGNLNLDAGCRYNLYEASHATGCLQGSWIMMTGSSNTLLEFLVLFLLFRRFQGTKKRFLLLQSNKKRAREEEVWEKLNMRVARFFRGNITTWRCIRGILRFLPSKISWANIRFCWHCPKQIKVKTNTSSSACALKGSWFWRFWKPRQSWGLLRDSCTTSLSYSWLYGLLIFMKNKKGIKHWVTN